MGGIAESGGAGALSGRSLPDGARKQGFVIPVYNHGKAVGGVVKELKELGLPIIMVDDGSDGETKEALEKIRAEAPLVVLVRLSKNGGKGAAVSAGLEKAFELGLTHVLQIDADGQHDCGRAGFFLEESATHPEAVICAYPEYDDTVPSGRRSGRKIANTWTKIVTLSPEIIESMLGFRVYPVERVCRLCRKHRLDSRMGFDIEILIRLYWEGVSFIFHPVRVMYPADGISHFRVVRDNLRISWVYTRLCCGMLVRLPLLLGRVIKRGMKHG
ncbi:MAG: glycosyltransferase family 2 protein [Treponema sp.]|jgi:glycosyltransferase involved in cell wall biosynthesis|nr:glycosyltransferase family 2 protein [Treponema sp.]